jgi:transposase
MVKDVEKLPDDVAELKAIITQQQGQIASLQTDHQHEIDSLQTDHQQEVNALQAQHQQELASLQEQLYLLIHKRFGRSSEKAPAEQQSLFNEAEQDDALFDTDEETTVAAHSRKKSGRQKLSDALPRVEIIHDIPESEKVCPHDGHALKVMGQESSEQLDIIPAKVRVLRHIRLKYSCPCCEKGVKIAPVPKQPIPKSIASPGLLAYICVSKYVDALPLYRQEKIFKRIGVDIPRASLANWMVRMGGLIQPLINLLREQMLSYDLMQMDETTVQVLNEEKKAASSKSYMWIQRGGPPGKPVILFDYDPSRSSTVPLRLLEGFKGYLQVDGYEGYNAAVKANGLVQLGCWAHARRKFDEAVKAQGRKKGKPKAGKALKGMSFIQNLYRIEKLAKEMTTTERTAYRQEHSVPILDEMRAWLDSSLPQVPPTSLIGKALNYLNNQWAKLIIYVEDGRLNIDNNLAENAIRPFVLGRKNWLFSHSVKGAEASANLYGLIETVKANGLEPYHYLRHVFKELPKAESLEQIEALLPFNLSEEELTESID